MNWFEPKNIPIFILLFSVYLLVACESSLPDEPSPAVSMPTTVPPSTGVSVTVTETEVQTSPIMPEVTEETAVTTAPPTELPATNTPLPEQPISSGLVIVPAGWYMTEIELPKLTGTVFVKQDPALLALFADPQLALPADFAGGAVLVTPLPADADPNGLQAGLEASLNTFTDQDFEALLVGADEAGLINLAAISHTQLVQAQANSLDGRSALMFLGTIHFVDERPPILQAEIWLTWTDSAFVTFYALATQETWPQVFVELYGARQSVHLP